MIKLYKKLINWRCKFILPSQLENCVLIKKKVQLAKEVNFTKKHALLFVFRPCLQSRSTACHFLDRPLGVTYFRTQAE